MAQCSVTLWHPTHGEIRLALHAFRDLLHAAEAEHAKKCCTRCGILLDGQAWNGGAGRRLCSECGPAEGATRERRTL